MKLSPQLTAWVRQSWLLLLSLLVLVAVASALTGTGRAALADLQSMQVRAQIDQLRTGQAKPPAIAEWGRLRNTLDEVAQLTPQDAQLHEALGYLYAIRAQNVAKIPELYGPFMRQAADNFSTAGRLRPMSGPTWANLALARHLLLSSAIPMDVKPTAEGQVANEVADRWFAYDRAKLYGQREPGIQTMLDTIGSNRYQPSVLR